MKTANKCYQAKPQEVLRRWYVVDATGQALGRLAARIARVLMGKHKPTYTPHVDGGDYVIVLNAGKIRLTGKKMETMVYHRYTRYPSGLKEIPIRTMLARRPEHVLREAVRRMLPKNRLARRMLAKLKLCAGDRHPHQAQQPEPLPL